MIRLLSLILALAVLLVPASVAQAAGEKKCGDLSFRPTQPRAISPNEALTLKFDYLVPEYVHIRALPLNYLSIQVWNTKNTWANLFKDTGFSTPSYIQWNISWEPLTTVTGAGTIDVSGAIEHEANFFDPLTAVISTYYCSAQFHFTTTVARMGGGTRTSTGTPTPSTQCSQSCVPPSPVPTGDTPSALLDSVVTFPVYTT